MNIELSATDLACRRENRQFKIRGVTPGVVLRQGRGLRGEKATAHGDCHRSSPSVSDEPKPATTGWVPVPESGSAPRRGLAPIAPTASGRTQPHCNAMGPCPRFKASSRIGDSDLSRCGRSPLRQCSWRDRWQSPSALRCRRGSRGVGCGKWGVGKAKAGLAGRLPHFYGCEACVTERRQSVPNPAPRCLNA